MREAKVTLVVTDGPMRGRVFEFVRHDTFFVGRAASAHFCLPDDKFFSRHHFMIEAAPPRVYLRDLGSTNGTRVDGELVREGFLRDGSVISCGATRFRVMIDSGESGDERADLRAVGHSEPPANPIPAFELARTDPHKIPGYIIGQPIGEGGMGRVFRAIRKADGADVAVKIISPRYRVTARAAQMFLREADVGHRLVHPNIVRTFDVGEADGLWWLAMEYVPGPDLTALVRGGGRPSPAIVLPLIAAALDGLAHAHALGFVHRDVKPENILMVGPNGGGARSPASAKLTDFGLAKSFEDSGASGISRTGETIGSLPYMPPEQVLDCKYVKPPCDVYAVGATLYFLLTGGHFIFEFSRGKDPMLEILEGRQIPLHERDPAISAGLERIIMTAISRNENVRPSAAQFRRQLLDFLIGEA